MRVIIKQKIFRNMLPLIWFIFNEHYKYVLPEDSIGFFIFFVPAKKEIKRLNITITPLWTGISTRAIAQMLGKSTPPIIIVESNLYKTSYHTISDREKDYPKNS